MNGSTTSWMLLKPRQRSSIPISSLTAVQRGSSERILGLGMPQKRECLVFRWCEQVRIIWTKFGKWWETSWDLMVFQMRKHANFLDGRFQKTWDCDLVFLQKSVWSLHCLIDLRPIDLQIVNFSGIACGIQKSYLEPESCLNHSLGHSHLAPCDMGFKLFSMRQAIVIFYHEQFLWRRRNILRWPLADCHPGFVSSWRGVRADEKYTTRWSIFMSTGPSNLHCFNGFSLAVDWNPTVAVDCFFPLGEPWRKSWAWVFHFNSLCYLPFVLPSMAFHHLDHSIYHVISPQFVCPSNRHGKRFASARRCGMPPKEAAPSSPGGKTTNAFPGNPGGSCSVGVAVGFFGSVWSLGLTSWAEPVNLWILGWICDYTKVGWFPFKN